MRRSKSTFTRSDKIAFVALVISVAGIGISIWTVLEQRRQWRATTLGAVVFDEVELVPFRVYGPDEVRPIDFGYRPDLVWNTSPDLGDTGKALLLTRLVPFKKRLLGDNSWSLGSHYCGDEG